MRAVRRVAGARGSVFGGRGAVAADGVGRARVDGLLVRLRRRSSANRAAEGVAGRSAARGRFRLAAIYPVLPGAPSAPLRGDSPRSACAPQKGRHSCLRRPLHNPRIAAISKFRAPGIGDSTAPSTAGSAKSPPITASSFPARPQFRGFAGPRTANGRNTPLPTRNATLSQPVRPPQVVPQRLEQRLRLVPHQPHVPHPPVSVAALERPKHLLHRSPNLRQQPVPLLLPVRKTRLMLGAPGA